MSENNLANKCGLNFTRLQITNGIKTQHLQLYQTYAINSKTILHTKKAFRTNHYCVIHFCVPQSYIARHFSWSNTTLRLADSKWVGRDRLQCTIIVYSYYVNHDHCGTAEAAFETLLCFPFLCFNNLILVCHSGWKNEVFSWFLYIQSLC